MTREIRHSFTLEGQGNITGNIEIIEAEDKPLPEDVRAFVQTLHSAFRLGKSLTVEHGGVQFTGVWVSSYLTTAVG